MDIVYRSSFYTLYQSSKERCFYIDFGSKMVRMSLCQLLSLRHKVMTIAIERHFDSTLNKHGFEILQLCNKSHLFILNTFEILDIKQLITGGFATLGLAANKEMVSI